MGTNTDTKSDDVSELIAKQFKTFQSEGKDKEDEMRKERIRLLRGRTSNLLDTFNTPSNTLGG